MGKKIALNEIGLPAGLADISFCQGRFDSRYNTTGAFVVKSSGSLNRKGTLKDLNIKYWFRAPDNRAQELPLIQIKTDKTGGVSEFTVAGRKIDPANRLAVDASLQAVRRIHDALKGSELPELAQIVHECDLRRHVDERINIYGQNPKGGLDFKFTHFFNGEMQASNDDMALPDDPEMLQALFGAGHNSYAPHSTFISGKRNIPSVHIPTGKAFDNQFTVNTRETGSITIDASITPEAAKEPVYYPDLVKVFTRARGGDKGFTLEGLSLAGKDLSEAGHAEQAKAVAVINGMMTDVSAHNAPIPMVHFARFDQMGQVMTSPLLNTGKKGSDFHFYYISRFGNRLTNVYGDFGAGLGSCKELRAGGVVGMLDYALEPAKDGSPYSGAIPNINDVREDLSFLALTHRHIDHIGGLPYANLPPGLPVLATPQVIEHAKHLFRRVYGSQARNYMPKWMPLTESGFQTFSKDGGKSGLTVIYAPNAVPHSSYTTPYYVAAFHTDADGKKHIKGVYTNLGDCRDEDNVNDHFFKQGWRDFLQKAHPDLAASEIPQAPTLAEWDSTSVRYRGKSPRKSQIIPNKDKIANWFEGCAILDAHLASSDNTFEINLTVAANQRRDVTMFGKNMEDTQSVNNIFGYNELGEPWPQGHQNQIFMDGVHKRNMQAQYDAHISQYGDHDPKQTQELWAALENKYEWCHKLRKPGLDAALEHTRADKKKIAEHYHARHRILERYKMYKAKAEEIRLAEHGNEELAKEYDRKADAKLKASVPYTLFLERAYYHEKGEEHKARLAELKLIRQLHSELSGSAQNYWRYKMRKEYAQKYGIADHRDLGAIVITRSTQTSAMMFGENRKNMYIPITGSQGNDVEQEAQLMKILENRALLRGVNPRFRHTARPISAHETVLMISQPVIPSNEKAREKTVKRAVQMGLVVVNATHDGFEIHNFQKLPEIVQTRIKKDLGAQKTPFSLRSSKELLVVPVMPIGYRGHGRYDDVSVWIGERVRAEVNSSQHVNDPEADHCVQTIARSHRLGARARIDDHEIVEIDGRAASVEGKVRTIGRIPSGITLLRNESPFQKPFGQITLAESVVLLQPQGCATHLEPLMAGCEQNVAIKKEFGRKASPEEERERPRGPIPALRPAAVEAKPGSGHDWAPRSRRSAPPLPGQTHYPAAGGAPTLDVA